MLCPPQKASGPLSKAFGSPRGKAKAGNAIDQTGLATFLRNAQIDVKQKQSSSLDGKAVNAKVPIVEVRNAQRESPATTLLLV